MGRKSGVKARRPWVAPKVTRMVAGDAEAGTKTQPDGGFVAPNSS
jgi:hypothetical protein